MDAFEATLKRAFAESHDDPADAGFSVRVSQGVARVERLAKVRIWTQAMGLAAAGSAAAYGGLQLVQIMGPQFLASVGLEFARAHGALASTSLGLGLTEVLIVVAAIGGGAAALRSAQG